MIVSGGPRNAHWRSKSAFQKLLYYGARAFFRCLRLLLLKVRFILPIVLLNNE
jgi:hypothetical protein